MERKLIQVIQPVNYFQSGRGARRGFITLLNEILKRAIMR